jgi:hypothetical protein
MRQRYDGVTAMAFPSHIQAAYYLQKRLSKRGKYNYYGTKKWALIVGGWAEEQL